MKRIISALLILIMMIPPMVLPAAAAEAVTHADSVVFVTAEKTGGSEGEAVTVGDEVTVTVAYENIAACSSIDFNLVYDTAYLEEPAKGDVTMNVGGNVKEKNPTATMDGQISQELQGKKAVKVAAAGNENCLKGESGTLFSVKFVIKAEAPAPGIPLEFVGVFNNLYSGKNMWNTIEVVNTHIATANPTKSVSEVSLINGPTKTAYLQGQALNMEGGHLQVTYSDASKETVRLSLAELIQYDFNKLGTQTVKATYAGKEVSFDIQTEESQLSSISVGKTPDKIEYTLGATGLSKEGGVLLLHYSSGVIETMDMNDPAVTVSDYDSVELNNKIITVTYLGFQTEFKIAVVRKPLSKIDVRTPMICDTCKLEQSAFDLITKAGGDPSSMGFSKRQEFIANTKNNVTCLSETCSGNTFTAKMKKVYYLGEDFDVGNATLFVTYEDTTTEELPLTLEMVEFNNSIPTEQTVQVTYGSVWTSIQKVVTKNKEIVEVTVSQKPKKLTYVQGKPFDPAGGKILVKYDNDTEEELPMSHSDVTITADMNALGDHKVTVRYRYKQASFYIHIDALAVENIYVDPEAPSTYIEGTPLDPNTKLFVEYNDGETKTAYLMDAAVSGYDANTIGLQEVLITYGKKNCTWQVLVEEKPIVNVRDLAIVGALPATIVEGLELNLEGCTLTATYEDETVEEELPITAPMITFNNRKIGKQEVIITYKNKTVTFEIEVLAKAVEELKIEGTLPTTLLEGTALNLEGCTLTATYNDGEVKEDIAITPAMIEYKDEAGEQTVTVTYDKKSTTFKVTVRAKTAISIAVSTLPKTAYLEGKDTALNMAGGKITVSYDNNTKRVIDLSAANVSGFKKEVGTHTITVTYQGLETSFHIVVRPKEVIGIAIAAMPTKMMYRQGVEKFDPAGGKLTVFYNNDTQETVNLSKAKISGFSNLFAGNVTLTAAYQGYAVEFKVLILAENPFKDVKAADYFETPVLWAVTKGITNGTAADAFSPDADCTRGQIVTFLWRAAGEPKPETTKNPFKDVKKGEYYYNAVLWAVENGITNGMDATHFAPDASCTRGQVVTFLWRAAGEPKPETTQNPFKDVKKGEYYYNAVLWAVENGITNGMDATHFAPDATCTRGQIVTFLYRAELNP
ncbi:MAG: bacterial Ig-like domain-containing protein [Clostridia bacterium]|nr:bacterial Ig-like domain-containing protein [Clostridia bacterium]